MHEQTTKADAGAKTDAGPNYKATLNLPKTAFPMRANLVQRELESIKRWDKARVQTRAAEQDAARETAFVFHDGPPYANGSIHLGHMLNKSLKDFAVRSARLAGKSCAFTPGWDCHGLPIEHKVLSEMVESGKAEKINGLEPDKRRMAIRRACQAYAAKFAKLQSSQMQRLLTHAGYDTPYLTMQPAYEAACLDVFADLVEQRLVFRMLKPVHWSIANETALAEAELEYEDREDPSVFVEFETLNRATVEKAFGLEADTLDRTPTCMVWTTTPWTLPANLAVAVHPRVRYALVELDGSLTIIAEELVGTVAERTATADDDDNDDETAEPTVLGVATGDALVGLRYRHPFVDTDALAGTLGTKADNIHRVVAAAYVTVQDGTGLVHTAPGHGQEDYQTGLRENLPVYCPVQSDGTYDGTAPEWLRGVVVWDANKLVCERLQASGHLRHVHMLVHAYPHDWRGKSPVIFRATEQWFIGVDTPTKRDGRALRETAVDAIEGVEFLPGWGKNRLRGMLENRPDWCISRQRAWGLPIPAFVTPDGGVLLTAASVRAVAQTIREKGSDAWWTQTAAALLAHYDPAADPDAPKGLHAGTVGTLEKGRDIFDVWFESGCSWATVMRQRHGAFPVDLYLEGSDQHRGWFQVSLLTALGAEGRTPFRTVLTHGFMVDRDGRKMSKSLGNALHVDELMKSFGADVARWWIASIDYENDIKVDLSYFETAGEAYRKIRNTLRFMLSVCNDFTPSPDGTDSAGGKGMRVPTAIYEPTMLDAWAAAECDTLCNTVMDAYARFDFRAASNAVFRFCNETLSAVYLAAVKDRLYCDAADSQRRRRTQSTVWDIADKVTRLLAPLLPHTADEAFRELRSGIDDEPCVHLQTIGTPLGIEADHEAWNAMLAAREAGLLALEHARNSGGVENPLDAGLVLPDPEGTLAKISQLDAADLFGVSRVRFDKAATQAVVEDLREEPRCQRSWKRDGTVKERQDGGLLSDRDAAAVGVR